MGNTSGRAPARSAPPVPPAAAPPPALRARGPCCPPAGCAKRSRPGAPSGPDGKDIPQSSLSIDGLGVFGDSHTAITIKTQKFGRQGVFPQPCLQEPSDISWIKGEDLFAPEVMGHLLHQGLRVIVD